LKIHGKKQKISNKIKINVDWVTAFKGLNIAWNNPVSALGDFSSVFAIESSMGLADLWIKSRNFLWAINGCSRVFLSESDALNWLSLNVVEFVTLHSDVFSEVLVTVHTCCEGHELILNWSILQFLEKTLLHFLGLFRNFLHFVELFLEIGVVLVHLGQVLVIDVSNLSLFLSGEEVCLVLLEELTALEVLLPHVIVGVLGKHLTVHSRLGSKLIHFEIGLNSSLNRSFGERVSINSDIRGFTWAHKFLFIVGK
jgi:hypothetical protein